jgi:hypothetical protein
MKTVVEIQSEINNLIAQKWAIEKAMADANSVILVKEILDLESGIGITEEDYYAGTRLYSNIEGVKNIRFSSDNRIVVKVTSQIGYLLPEKLEIEGKTYEISFSKSKNFSETLDY